jgi:lysophospholipase L1-like esterase
MIFDNGDKIVFMGDSVTDDGRGRPIGELAYGLGNGYVNMIHSILNVLRPEEQYRFVNVGVSGENIRDVEKRWQNDVIDQKPDWLSFCIGINDVWNQYLRPLQTEIQVLPEDYREIMERLIVKTKPLVKGIILMTPYYMETNPDDTMRKRMDEYGQIVKDLAAKYDCVLVDLQEAFNDYLQYRYTSFLSWDRVHPNGVGAMVISNAFLKATGLDLSKA